MTPQHQHDRLQVVGQMTAAVAHDFNNLLTVILSHGRLLHDTLQSDPLGHHAAQIVSASERAGRLTQRLLGYLHRAPNTRESSETHAHLAIAELLSISESLLRCVEWVTTLNATDDRVGIDGDRFDQIVMNLVCNARDAMPDGGMLIVSTRNVSRPSRTTAEDAAFLVIEVIDNGQGMPPALQARAFDPFFTTKAVGRGTGLGLATVRDTVETAGGYVEFESIERLGTTVRIMLPVQTASIAPLRSRS